MTKTTEEQAEQLAQTLIGIGETRLPPEEKQKHAEIAIIHALRNAKADGMECAAERCTDHADFCKDEAHKGGAWEHLMTRYKEANYLADQIRAAAPKVRDGE